MKTSYRGPGYEAGKALRALRSRIGLTQQELGDHLGITARTVRKWEVGESYPPMVMQLMWRIAMLGFGHCEFFEIHLVFRIKGCYHI